MSVSFLEYRSNSYCNECFDERSATKISKNILFESFDFMGETFPLEVTTKDNQKSSYRLRNHS